MNYRNSEFDRSVVHRVKHSRRDVNDAYVIVVIRVAEAHVAAHPGRAARALVIGGSLSLNGALLARPRREPGQRTAAVAVRLAGWQRRVVAIFVPLLLVPVRPGCPEYTVLTIDLPVEPS